MLLSKWGASVSGHLWGVCERLMVVGECAGASAKAGQSHIPWPSCPALTLLCDPGGASCPLWAPFFISKTGMLPISISGWWEAPGAFVTWIDYPAGRVGQRGKLGASNNIQGPVLGPHPQRSAPAGQQQPHLQPCPTQIPDHPDLEKLLLLPSSCPSTPPGASYLQGRSDCWAGGLENKLLIAAAPGLPGQSDLSQAATWKQLA